jgi:very-short-patch-repair endonuclease
VSWIKGIDHADTLYCQLVAVGLCGWSREYRFHKTRRWRVDCAHVSSKLAVEVEGFAAGGTSGRHQRAGGFTADCEKYAELAIAGWRLIRVTGNQVKNGQALQWIERALGVKP